MAAFVAAGAGFLLAVLWFDLMFDVQARRRPDGADLPEAALASIASYYARVTTLARPMNRLVGLVMLGTLTAIGIQIAGGDAPAWAGWVSLGLAGAPIGLAATRTFPNAVRLGTQRDPVVAQTRLARSIYRDHRFCFAAVTALIVVQLGFAR